MLIVNEVIARDPEVLGGTPVFRGTRVSFQALLEQGKLLMVSQLG